jgi:hypothetical protein
MIHRRVLIGFGVALLTLWSAAPVLAGGYSGPTGWTQMSGTTTPQPDESLWSICGGGEDMLESMPWPAARQAAMQEWENTEQEGVAGRIHDFFTTRLMGEATPHVLAQIDTPRGTATVDLGSVEQVPPLQTGEFIRLRGFWARVNNRNVFVTTRLNNGVRTVNIFVGPQRQNVAEIRGTILGTYTISSDQTGQELRVARVQMENGRRRIVNLGPPSDTASLDLKRGDEIAAVGRPVGLFRFRAFEVSANGQTVPISRAAMARALMGERFREAGFMERH